MSSYDIGKLIYGLGPRIGVNPGNASFSGAFASLFPGALQVVQTDIGLTYGTTMLATGTTPPVITLSGSLSTVPVPITVTCTLIGIRGIWTGTYSFDGGSTTTAFTSAATINLTGKGSGLVLNIAAGTAAINDVWKATCSGLADQSGGGWNYSQAGTGQPIITVGINGKPGLLFDATRTTYLSSSFAAPVPGTTAYSIYMVMTPATFGSQQNFIGSTGSPGASTLYDPGSLTSLTQFNGASANMSAVAAARARIVADYTNSINDRIKSGSNVIVTGQSAGNSAGVAQAIGAGTAGGNFPANLEFFMMVIAPLISNSQLGIADAAINSTNGYGSGNVLV